MVQRYFTLVAFHAGPVPGYCLTVSGENAAARNCIGGKGVPSAIFSFFLSFFIPFDLTDLKEQVSCSFFWGRGFLLFTDEFVGIEISEEKEEVRFSIEAFHFRGRGDERSNF